MYIVFIIYLHSDDIVQAIKRLKILGSGFTLIPAGSSYIVQSVPGEMSLDHTTILQYAEACIKLCKQTTPDFTRRLQ